MRVFSLSNFGTGSTKQAVAEFHDIRFMNASNLFTVVLLGKVERETGDTFGFRSSHDFEGFDNSGDGLML